MKHESSIPLLAGNDLHKRDQWYAKGRFHDNVSEYLQRTRKKSPDAEQQAALDAQEIILNAW